MTEVKELPEEIEIGIEILKQNMDKEVEEVLKDKGIIEVVKSVTHKKEPTDKTQWHLLPWNCLEDVVKVFQKGNEKYTPDSWKEGDVEFYLDALMRHLKTRFLGIKKDSDSGLLTTAHIAANALILLWFDKEKR